MVSLGSLHYEPIWIYYCGKANIVHFSQLEGKRIAVGRVGHGTEVIVRRLLKMSHVNLTKTTLMNFDSAQAATALEKGEIDAAFFMLPPESPILHDLALNADVRLMDVEQAEAIARKDAAFHHLVVPRGAIDLENDEPDRDTDLKVELDPKQQQIFLRGVVNIPVEELKAINLDPKLGAFRFQLTIKPEATRKGYLVLDFPLNETFFYPVTSKNPAWDRVVIPTQMLSLALASARGYFSALSGDFSEFDRRTAKTKALIKTLDRSISTENNADLLDSMKTEREAQKLKLASIPIERKQMAAKAKELSGPLAFTGEKDLNDQFMARQNAIILKINIAKLVPYLSGISLDEIHIVHDKKDGPRGENYFSVDIAANLGKIAALNPDNVDPSDGLKIPPAAMIRINQTLFESELIVEAEKKAMGSKLQDLKIEFKNDGLHVSGKYHKYFISIPFDTIVDFHTAQDSDSFDVSVRNVEVAGMDLEFMTGFVLSSMEKRLDQSLKGLCTFEYIGKKKDHSRALRVHLDPAKLIPALPGLHLVDVEIRDGEFLLKVGKL